MFREASVWAAEIVECRSGFDFSDLLRVWIYNDSLKDRADYVRTVIHSEERFDNDLSNFGFTLTRVLRIAGRGSYIPDWARRIDLSKCRKFVCAARIYVTMRDLLTAPRKCHSTRWCGDHEIGRRDDCRRCALYKVFLQNLYEMELKAWRTENHKLQKAERQLKGIRELLKTPGAQNLLCAD